MASRTVERGVGPDERERMIYRCTGPCRRFVAGFTIGGKTCRLVIRVRGRVVVVAVAIHTLGREARIHIPGVARIALLGRVRTDQRPYRVVVVRLEPVRVGLLVAGFASKSGDPPPSGSGQWSRCSPLYDSHTIRREPRIHATRMASRTVERGVGPNERERMIYLCTGPCRRFVAGFAVGGEAPVWWFGSVVEL